jgi:4-oxalocrotonate tautomerase
MRVCRRLDFASAAALIDQKNQGTERPRQKPGDARSRVAAQSRRIRRNSNTKGKMPLVNVKLIEGVFSPAQKQEMIRKLTDAMVSVEGEHLRPVTSVVIEEVKSGDWGIGGHPLTTQEVKAHAAGKSKA